MAVGDVERGDTAVGRDLVAEVYSALRNRQFDVLLMDAGWYKDSIRAYYTSIDFVFNRDDVFFPVTGFRIRPQYYLVPLDSL